MLSKVENDRLSIECTFRPALPIDRQPLTGKDMKLTVRKYDRARFDGYLESNGLKRQHVKTLAIRDRIGSEELQRIVDTFGNLEYFCFHGQDLSAEVVKGIAGLNWLELVVIYDEPPSHDLCIQFMSSVYLEDLSFHQSPPGIDRDEFEKMTVVCDRVRAPDWFIFHGQWINNSWAHASVETKDSDLYLDWHSMRRNEE